MYKFGLLGAICILSVPFPLWGSGFQIPNQSVTAIGTAGAHIAYTPGPDSAYYNAANMSFLPDSWAMEASLTTLYLPSIDYCDNRSPLLNGSSESELFLLPLLHISSKQFDKFRFGFSVTTPYGLAKNWSQPFPAATSEEFSLMVVEASPVASYSFRDNFSIGAGLRFIYGKGEVKNSVTNPPFDQLAPITTLARDVEGDDMQLGYSLAATFRPTTEWALAATYKSESTLKLEGDALLAALAGQIYLAGYRGSGHLDVSLPAVFSLASSYRFGDLTVELTWNRTFWSAFEELDFEYDQTFTGTIFNGFDQPVEKNWDDSDAIRLGASYYLTNTLTSTLGFSFDETPVPASTLGFELPDSDSYMYSMGIQYQQSESIKIAMAYMYQHTTSRSIENTPANGLPAIDGKFTNGGAHAVTFGLVYDF